MTARTRRQPAPASAACLLAAAIALSACGCTNNGPPYVTPGRLDRGLIVVLGGVDGVTPNVQAIRKGLMDGRLGCAVEIFDWIGPWRLGVSYAFDRGACYEAAGRLAARIDAYRAQRPGRPVYLVGHSGGGAIAVFTAELTPADRPLDGLVIMAPALHPRYDLSSALIGCGKHLVNCYAESDFFLRGLTTIGSNLDGVNGASAGQDGFTLPPGAPPRRAELFGHLRQIRWDKSMAGTGHLGGHFGWSSRSWIAAYVAPIIREWSGFAPVDDRPGSTAGR